MKPLLKAIFFTDTHMKGVSPRSRIDNYPEAMLEKIRWIIHFGVDKEVDVFLHGADFFDAYDVENSVKISFVEALSEARRAGIPIVGTVGSHDQVGYQIKTLNRSSVGVLETTDIIVLLRRGQVWYHNGVMVIGCPHDINLDHTEEDGWLGYMIDYAVPEEVALAGGPKKTILLAHGNIVDKPLQPGFHHTLIEEAEVNADIVLSGHYHYGYPTHVREDGKIFCNPSSVARLEDTKANRKRTPSIAYIEVFEEAPPTIAIIPIQASRPGSEIFAETEPLPEPDQNDVAAMVEDLKRKTAEVGAAFDAERAILQVSVEGAPELVEEARRVALAAVQQAKVETKK